MRCANDVSKAQTQPLPHQTSPHTVARHLNFTNDILLLIGPRDKFLTRWADTLQKWTRSTTCSTATKTSSRPR